jgi:hypothetical protein
MDSLDGQFLGYTDGDLWNGWACPYFVRDVAERVLKASEANGYTWTFSSERDSFVVRNAEDPEDYAPEEFQSVLISFSGQETKVYSIGAYSWIWDTCE